jgi:hypothetical protein
MQTKNDEKQKALYENFMKIITHDQSQPIPQPNKSGSYPQGSSIKQDSASDKNQVTGQQQTLIEIYNSTVEK